MSIETPNQEQKPVVYNPFPHAMRWGLVLGACLTVNFFMSVSGNAVLSLLTWVLDIGILYLVYRIVCNYRDKECGGQMRYFQVFSYILLLFFFASLVASAVKYVYLQFLAPDYLTSLYNQVMLLLEEMNVNLPAGFSDQFRVLMQPIQYAMQSITTECLLGGFIGIIYGFIVRRTKQGM